MSSTLVSLLLGAAALYLLLSATLFVNQQRFIYFPDRHLATSPAQLGLAYESISFSAADHTMLHGWFIPADSGKNVILFCHGNGGNISHRLETIDILHRLGFSLFLFDYRGYGKSEGSPSEDGTYLDAQAAWDYLTQQRGLRPEEIILFGRSLGGALAAHISATRRPRACVLESTFTSLPAMAAAHYPYFPTALLCRYRYDTIGLMGTINVPLLIIHSPDDEIIPFRQGRELYAAARQPKRFLQINGNHNAGFLVSGRLYEQGLADFLNNPTPHQGP